MPKSRVHSLDTLMKSRCLSPHCTERRRTIWSVSGESPAWPGLIRTRLRNARCLRSWATLLWRRASNRLSVRSRSFWWPRWSPPRASMPRARCCWNRDPRETGATVLAALCGIPGHRRHDRARTVASTATRSVGRRRQTAHAGPRSSRPALLPLKERVETGR